MPDFLPPQHELTPCLLGSISLPQVVVPNGTLVKKLKDPTCRGVAAQYVKGLVLACDTATHTYTLAFEHQDGSTETMHRVPATDVHWMRHCATVIGKKVYQEFAGGAWYSGTCFDINYEPEETDSGRTDDPVEDDENLYYIKYEDDDSCCMTLDDLEFYGNNDQKTRYHRYHGQINKTSKKPATAVTVRARARKRGGSSVLEEDLDDSGLDDSDEEDWPVGKKSAQPAKTKRRQKHDSSYAESDGSDSNYEEKEPKKPAAKKTKRLTKKLFEDDDDDDSLGCDLPTDSGSEDKKPTKKAKRSTSHNQRSKPRNGKSAA